MRVGVEVVTRLRAPLAPTGPSGRLSRDWTRASSTVLKGCSFQPLSTTEFIDSREFAETHWKLILPGAADIVSSDRVIWLGSTYEVDGNAENWNDMKGTPQHTTVLVKRWTG